MTSISARLAALKKNLEDGRADNLKAVQEEETKAAAQDKTDETGTEIEDVLSTKGGTGGDKKEGRKRGRDAKRRFVESGDLRDAVEADGEDDDERVRGMKRRARASVQVLSREVKPGHEGRDEVLVYGGAGSVERPALDNMVNELQAVEKRREKFRRRRTFDEENSDISFINEGNRLFNRTLDRHFNKFDSVKEIQDNLERGTA